MLHRLIGEDIELITQLDGAVNKMMVDQGQLEQALVNMAGNARDAMPNGGQLRILTENFEIETQAAGKYQKAVLAGPYVHLTISDEGVCINSATRALAFESLFT